MGRAAAARLGALLGLWLTSGCGGCGGPGDVPEGATDTAGTGGDGDGGSDAGSTDGGEAGSCGEQVPARALRLLTRREYDATVRDLFGLEDPTSCDADEQCPSNASCTDAGTCEQLILQPTTFRLPANGATWSTVHVAGTFNNWPGAIVDGGLPLAYDAGTDTWAGSYLIDPGTHEYKFVLDETDWIQDPENPNETPDGVGGNNSVIEVTTDSVQVPPNPLSFAADFPVESRPAGFGYDNNAAAGLVTSVHAEKYMRTAQDVVAVAMADTSWLPCTPDGDGAACAEQIARDVGRRVFRRPLDDDEVTKYQGLILGEGDFDEGVRVAVEVMLASPMFLYRFEIGEADGDRFRLTDHEIATALSYGLWGTTPDAELLAAADAGELSTADWVEAQARRLLLDDRARDLLGLFALQWLGVERIATADKNTDLFPQFDPALRAAMLEETRRFVAHVALEGTGSFDELLTADYTFANDQLAQLYGMPDGPGATHEQVPLPGGRVGLLSQGSVLGSYAYSDQTSPVRRGLFVRRSLLCQELPDPPPNAGAVPEVDANATTRERFSQHMDDPSCASCHRYIDPVGFGFEQFDPIGAWRDLDAGQPVDATGSVEGLEDLGGGDVQAFATLPELAQILVDSQAAPQCFARQYFRFTHGRHETDEDDCALQQLQERFDETGHDIVDLVVATLTAPEFRYRK